MTNITREVWDFLIRDLAIQKHLQKGVLNVRALAKQIKKQKNLNSSLDAIISAIRRFSDNKRIFEETTKIEEIFKNANVTTKNNIACVMLKDQSDILKYLVELTRITNIEKRETLRIIKGKNNLKILVDMKNLKKIKKYFLNKDVEIKEDLSEIRIIIGSRGDQTKGVAARVSSEMMLRDINISEFIFCVPEIIIYVDQKDLLGAHESIMQLCRKK